MVTFAVLATSLALVEAAGKTIVYMSDEKFILNPVAEEMRSRKRADGSSLEVIPGSVGFGYIVEDLNSRMKHAMQNGLEDRCLRLQQMSYEVEQRRQELEVYDMQVYGGIVKLSQESPLLCADLMLEERAESEVNERLSKTYWLFMGVLSALCLSLILYLCGFCDETPDKSESGMSRKRKTKAIKKGKF